MLGEGRNFFFFASSDFHQRGGFGANERQSTADFFPGEYQKLYVPKPKGGPLRPQTAVDGLRSGNSFSVTGDLITSDFTMEASVVGNRAAPKKMGETLTVPKGKDVQITLTVTLPDKPNNSPYAFDNPSLLQAGIHQPLNQPRLDHVDFIGGAVTGVVAAERRQLHQSHQSVGAAPGIVRQKHACALDGGWAKAHDDLHHPQCAGRSIHPCSGHQHARRDTERNGRQWQSAFGCTTGGLCNSVYRRGLPGAFACGQRREDVHNDVASWSDLWFYGNPIFIRVQGHPQFLVEANAKLADNLRKVK